jgi:hypothetical protein
MAEQQNILDRPLRDFANKCFWCGADVGSNQKSSKSFPCVCKDCFFVLKRHRGDWYPLRDGEPIKTRFSLRPCHWVDIMFGLSMLIILLLTILAYGGKL